MDGRILLAQLRFQNGAVAPHRVEVDLEILSLVGQAVARLAHLLLCAVGLLQQILVLALGKPFLDLDARLVVEGMVVGLEIHHAVGLRAAVDAQRHVLAGDKIGLDDVHFPHPGKALEPVHIRVGDQESALDLARLRLAEEGAHLGDEAAQLGIEVGGVVDDAQMRMGRPSRDQPVVEVGSLLDGLDAGLVVFGGVKLRQALRRGHQMKHRVIAREQLLLGAADLGQHLGVVLGRHIDLVVDRAAVADDEELVGLHRARGPLKQALLLQLQGHLHLLVVEIRAAGPGRDAAGDELRRRLRHKEHGIAELGKGVLDPAHGGRFAAAGAAGDHDSADFHGIVLRFGDTIKIPDVDVKSKPRGEKKRKASPSRELFPVPCVLQSEQEARCF